jgi:hypothetical protein
VLELKFWPTEIFTKDNQFHVPKNKVNVRPSKTLHNLYNKKNLKLEIESMIWVTAMENHVLSSNSKPKSVHEPRACWIKESFWIPCNTGITIYVLLALPEKTWDQLQGQCALENKKYLNFWRLTPYPGDPRYQCGVYNYRIINSYVPVLNHSVPNMSKDPLDAYCSSSWSITAMVSRIPELALCLRTWSLLW